jgi:hypothetical protein
LPIETPSTSTRKRVAAQPAPVYQRTKKPRTNVAHQALADIATAAGDITSIMGSLRDALAAPVPSEQAPALATDPIPGKTFQLSPQRRADAGKLAQRETWLTPPQRVALVKVVRDVKLADEYTNFDTEEMRVLWVLDQLQDVGVVAFHPDYSFKYMDYTNL